VRWWKVLGLAAVGGVVAAGVVAQRRRRQWRSYDSDELRARLHRRLEAAGTGTATLPAAQSGATVDS
jgi:hypothetical protein